MCFQAEGGIRGRNVTGVQTCALPISLRKKSPASPSLHINKFQQLIGAAFNIVGENFVLRVSRDHIVVAAKGGSYAAHILQVKFRSEERRVGREGRDSWSSES